MDPITQQGLAGSAGAGDDPVYVDDVFSTFLYDGTGSTQSINNGIDLSGEGGLVWTKRRNSGRSNILFDSERGASSRLQTNTNGAAQDQVYSITMNSDGHTWTGADNDVNASGSEYVSWTFRKAPGFFDVVTYTGNGSSSGQTISHNLGSIPGMIIVKRVNASESWAVFHRSTGNNFHLRLDSTVLGYAQNKITGGSATSFQVMDADGMINGNGDSYVAYIFAHDDQSFGTNGDESIIKCGSYTGTGSDGNFVNLGFEPQFLLIKNASSSNTAWLVCDTMRGMPASAGSTTRPIYANSSNAETYQNSIEPSPTGFTPQGSGSYSNSSGHQFIYMAIRRPHKPPTAGTEVFFPKAWTGTQSSHSYDAGFPMDLIFHTHRGGSSTATWIYDRLRGSNKRFISSSTSPEENADFLDFDKQNSVGINGSSSGYNANSENYIHHVFRRAPGFFDVVAYTGDAVAGRTVAHNLGVAPEMMMVLQRTATPGTTSGAKLVYASFLGNQGVVVLTSSNAAITGNASWYNTTPTATSFTLNNYSNTNGSGTTYIAYLFASLSGISKVGSYTGTGNDINVDCGFTSGARFVLIKQTGNSGDWYVWDSARGIVSGNEPFIRLNENNAESQGDDYIDPLNAGFTVTSLAPGALNDSGGTYLFLAIA